LDADALFDGWERAWSGRDPKAFDPLCDPGVRYEDPLCPEPLDGAAAIAAHAAQLWDAFPDARLNRTGERLYGGIYACAPCKLLGTHRGRLGGRIAATGRALEVHVLVYAELREERLLRVRAFYDVWDAARELGIVPRAGTASERAMLLLRGFGLRA
jgi:ketosteroid isomerase-like protein